VCLCDLRCLCFLFCFDLVLLRFLPPCWSVFIRLFGDVIGDPIGISSGFGTSTSFCGSSGTSFCGSSGTSFCGSSGTSFCGCGGGGNTSLRAGGGPGIFANGLFSNGLLVNGTLGVDDALDADNAL